jgi:hypothetical protein
VGSGASRGVAGVSVARVPKGSGEVVEKLLHGDVVPRGARSRLGSGGSAGRRRSQAAAEQGARRRYGSAVSVHGGEFGWAREHQRTTGMLFVLWTGGGERR